MAANIVALSHQQATSVAKKAIPVVTPVVIDWLNDGEDEIRAKTRKGFLGTLSPMVAIKNYGFEKVRQDVMFLAREQYECYDGRESCLSNVLDNANETNAQFRRELQQLSFRFCQILMGDAFTTFLTEKDAHLDGNLGIRFYPQQGPIGLGAHVDANEFTILWANGSGLQVPRQDIGLNSDDIRAIGLPSFTPAPPLCDDQWSYVDTFWQNDMLLLTVGEGWFSTEFPMNALFPGVCCPVLHRVHAPPISAVRSNRYSIPFQVRVLPRAAVSNAQI
jgi:hypothetical protein